MEHPVPILIENDTTVNISDIFTSTTVTSKMVTPRESRQNSNSANNNYYTIVLVGLGLIIYVILYIRRKRNKKRYMEKREVEYLNYYHSILPQSRIYRGASDTYTHANLTSLAESFQKETSDNHEGISGIAGLARLIQAQCKPLDTDETTETVCLTDVCADIPTDVNVYENQASDEIVTDEIEHLPNNGEIKSGKSLHEQSVSPNTSNYYRDSASLNNAESERTSNRERRIITKLDANTPHTTGVTDSSKAKLEQSLIDEKKVANNLDFLLADTARLSNTSNFNTEQSSVKRVAIHSPLTDTVTDSSKPNTKESSNNERKFVQRLGFLSTETRQTESSQQKSDGKNTCRKPKSHILASFLENLSRTEFFTVSENQHRNNYINMEEIVTDLDNKNKEVSLNICETTSTEIYSNMPKLVKKSSKDRNDNIIPSFNLVDCDTDKHYTKNRSDVVIFHDDYLTGTWI